LPLLFKIHNIEYIPLGRSKETKSSMKMNETHPLLVSAVDVNLLDGNSDTINKSIDVPLVAGEEVGLEVCAEKNCMYLQHVKRMQEKITT